MPKYATKVKKWIDLSLIAQNGNDKPKCDNGVKFINGQWVGQTGGVDLGELNSRKIAKSTKPKKSESQIINELKQNPQYNFMYRLFDYLAQQYGYNDCKLVFRNCGSKHKNLGENGHAIIVGHDDIADVYFLGMREYVTIYPIWRKIGYGGHKKYGYNGSMFRINSMVEYVGLWGLLLHEFAHLIVSKNGDRKWGDQHGKYFQDALNELITLVPFGEIAHFAN
jgi:hypothetical protein